jgi:hypothetical protein
VRRALGLALAAALLAACGDDAPEYLDRATMLDPEACADCHPKHVDEWKSSMHAYAGDDPVFVAMNARGQRETDGALGDFCVKCHAPMAVREGLTTDGLNLAELEPKYRGVTCYFCHSVESVEDDHNNPLVLADDLVMRGGFGDAIENGEHATAYSPLHDRNNPESSTLCGACHDIVTPAGVHLERTFLEYRESIFPDIVLPDGTAQPLTCGDCHSPGDDDVVADFDGVPLRERHEHTFPGLDTAAIEWPGKDLQREHIQRDLDPLLTPRICLGVGNQVEVRLSNDGAGHMFPSGSAQDRRVWVELRAYDGDTEIYASGVVPEGTSVTELADPDLWLLRDRAYDADGEETHMFWEVAPSPGFPAGYESDLLPPAVTFDPLDDRFDHSVLHIYPVGATPDRIELTVHIQAIGLDVLDDLIASGDLSPALRDVFPILVPDGARVTWTTALAGADRCFPKVAAVETTRARATSLPARLARGPDQVEDQDRVRQDEDERQAAAQRGRRQRAREVGADLRRQRGADHDGHREAEVDRAGPGVLHRRDHRDDEHDDVAGPRRLADVEAEAVHHDRDQDDAAADAEHPGQDAVGEADHADHRARHADAGDRQLDPRPPGDPRERRRRGRDPLGRPRPHRPGQDAEQADVERAQHQAGDVERAADELDLAEAVDQVQQAGAAVDAEDAAADHQPVEAGLGVAHRAVAQERAEPGRDRLAQAGGDRRGQRHAEEDVEQRDQEEAAADAEHAGDDPDRAAEGDQAEERDRVALDRERPHQIV